MINAIVTDIEGTTSSLSFVKEVLFPYARAHLHDYLAQNARRAEVALLLQDVRAIAGSALSDTEIVQELQQWIDADRKLTPLKALQGLIWQEGYRRGDFSGHVYEDAARNLKRWAAQGIKLYVYSSGSVQAQKLLFRYSTCGDLTSLFQDYFDTHTGAKREPESYRAIVRALRLAAGTVLFLSDIVPELDAAAAAGMQTRWVVRTGAAPAPSAHTAVASFDEITWT